MSHRETTCVFLPYGGSKNPYQDSLAEALQDFDVKVIKIGSGMGSLIKMSFGQAPDVIHLHWPDSYIFGNGRISSTFKALVTVFCFFIIRVRGRRIVWTLHNLHNHENRFPFIEFVFLKFFLRIVHRIIAHCEVARTALAAEHGKFLLDKTSVIPHGNYFQSYSNPPSRDQARKALNWQGENCYFVFLGNVRPYKGVLDLVQAFQGAGLRNSKLFVAGRVFDQGDDDLVSRAIGTDPNIEFLPGFVSKELLVQYLAAADVFVTPFKEVLTSGSIILAMTFGLPCIAPGLGCLPETLIHQPDLIYDSQDSEGLKQKLVYAALHRDLLPELGMKNKCFALDEMSWDSIARLTRVAYLHPVSGKVPEQSLDA